MSGIRIDTLRITDSVSRGICLARGSLHGARSFITKEGRAALEGLIRLCLYAGIRLEDPCFLLQARLRGHQSDCAHVNDMHIGHDKVNLRCKDPNRCRLDKANTPRLFDMLDSAKIL